MNIEKAVQLAKAVKEWLSFLDREASGEDMGGKEMLNENRAELYVRMLVDEILEPQHTTKSVAEEIADGLLDGTIVLDSKMKHQVLCQEWEESERGWGTRPDGYSLHLDESDCSSFIKAYWAEQPDRIGGMAPDEYSRPWGSPFRVDVSSSIYQQIQANPYGIRKFGRCPRP